MNKKKMCSGAGNYFQGPNILPDCGEELKRKGHYSVCIIGGEKALGAALPGLSSGLSRAGIPFSVHSFSGFCTSEEIDAYAALVRQDGSDCVMGVGGGKVMDLVKAVAALLGCAVYTVPTCAATCAAYAALSVVYNREGCQDHTRYHSDEVNGVFVDTQILAHAPARLLAAGMADAMAKSCEYSSMRSQLNYTDVDISKYLGYTMAKAGDEILLTCGQQAYLDNRSGVVSQSLEDAVYICIAATGIISNMGGFSGRTGSRFAIAHGFNEVLRGRYVGTRDWLHGEIVGVGILAQLHANGMPEAYQERVRSFYRAIGVPVTLAGMGISLDDFGFTKLQEELVQHSGVSEENAPRVREAVAFVRK
ncbi:iron-containing alcohol dehydrogenase [bacterium]|nr:iron-containing alcohol dehydrogenase [bacterium]